MSNQPTMPGHDAPFDEKVRWLLQTHAYCPPLNKVVKLYEPEGACLLKWSAFQFSFRPWHEISTGPKGGVRVIFATRIWEAHKDRLTLRGVGMRPDMPFPTYQEDGELFKNTCVQS